MPPLFDALHSPSPVSSASPPVACPTPSRRHVEWSWRQEGRMPCSGSPLSPRALCSPRPINCSSLPRAACSSKGSASRFSPAPAPATASSLLSFHSDGPQPYQAVARTILRVLPPSESSALATRQRGAHARSRACAPVGTRRAGQQQPRSRPSTPRMPPHCGGPECSAEQRTCPPLGPSSSCAHLSRGRQGRPSPRTAAGGTP